MSLNQNEVPISLNTIALEAPDGLISGLLAVVAAQSLALKKGALHPLPGEARCWYLIAAEKGCVWVTTDRGTRTLEPPQAVAFQEEGTVTLLPQQDSAVSLLLLKGSAADAILQAEQTERGLFFPLGGERVSASVRLLGHQAAGQGGVSPKAASLAAYDLLLGLYQSGARRKALRIQAPPVVAEALALIQRDFAFLEGISDLAARLEISQEYLTRVFRAHVGVTPGKYLNQVRVEYAKLLLRQEGHSVTFVSDACGFSNGNYFARVFRGLVGMNPSQYARAMGSAPPLPDSLPDSYYVL